MMQLTVQIHHNGYGVSQPGYSGHTEQVRGLPRKELWSGKLTGKVIIETAGNPIKAHWMDVSDSQGRLMTHSEFGH